jgi:hypothetical protein
LHLFEGGNPARNLRNMRAKQTSEVAALQLLRPLHGAHAGNPAQAEDHAV